MDSLHIESRSQENTLTLNLSGRFDFKTRHLFKEAMSEIWTHQHIDTIELQLAGLLYLDSSALGVLLKIWSDAREHGKVIRILNPRGIVAQALDIAQFHKLFDIIAA